MSIGYRKGLVNIKGDGPTLVAAASASCLPQAAKIGLPSNFFDTINQMLLIELWGRLSCAVTTPGTARFDVRLGGTVIFDGLAVPLNIVAKNNVGFHLKLALTLREIGAAAAFHGQGLFVSEAVIGSPLPSAGGSGAILLPFNTAPVLGTTFDSSAAQGFDMNFTQNVATGSMTVHQAVVESHRWE